MSSAVDGLQGPQETIFSIELGEHFLNIVLVFNYDQSIFKFITFKNRTISSSSKIAKKKENFSFFFKACFF